MAVDVAESTFDPFLMGDAIEELSAGNAVGFGYAINHNGNDNAAVGSGGQAVTVADDDADTNVRNFSSLVEMEVSSVSKTITATAVLHALESLPGGLDAALSTNLVDYLPSDWIPGVNVGIITLRHLLTHTSGFAEINNAIGVNFNSYGNNTFANLEALIEAGLPAPNVAADDVYDSQRWNLTPANGFPEGNYNNANFTLLARVVLPKLINPALNLSAANYPGTRDAASGAMYTNYVQNEIFEPLGIVGADMIGNDANPARGYDLPTANVVSGMSMSNHSALGGAFGWKLSARELGTFLDGIQRDNSILSPATRAMRNTQQLGWYNDSDEFGNYYGHNGATSNGNLAFRSKIEAMPGNVEVSYLMNSDDDTLPGGNIGNMLRTAYVNGWTDLVVNGTLGIDNFQATVVNDNGKDAIRVTLNGDIQFTRWLDGLDSITLNGGMGNDTFTISDWSSSVELIINGHTGDDTVNLLAGVGNIERVSGMTFNGGDGVDELRAHDHSNPYSMPGLSQLYAVGATGIGRYRGLTIPNNPLIPVPVTVQFAGVENLEVTTGGQADVVQLVSKTSGNTEIRTGGGNDVVQVAAGAANLEFVNGLFIDGQSGTDAVELHDENKAIGADFVANYDVDVDSVSRYVTGGLAIDPNPPVYEVDFAGIENLALTTTEGRDHIRVHRTTSGEVIVNAGAGNDTLVATPNSENMELVNDLTFHGEAGADAIVLNDQDNPYSHPGLSRIYGVSAAGVSRSAGVPSGPFLLAVPINASYSSVEELTLRTGGQSDVVNVASVPSAGALIETGSGNDAVVASSIAFNMETVNGLEVDGGLGEDSLTIRDENNPYELPGGSDFLVTPDSVRRYAEHVLFDNAVVPVEIGFEWVENVTVVAGDQTDEFVVEGEAEIGNTSLTLDGNAGGDLFRVRGPAFGEMHIQGDAPIFAPGDRLIVNEDGMYAAGTIPGLYPQGAGGRTIGDMTIQYTGIESATVQEQIYGGPGDFDNNGLVNAEDLTHATLGWRARFGVDLNGGDFLVWQRHLGANRLPRGGGGGLVAGTDELAQASVEPVEPAGDEELAYASIGSAPTSDDGHADETLALAYEGTTPSSSTPIAASKNLVVTRESALEAYAFDDESDDDDNGAEPGSADWDAAFESFGTAISLAV
jgi:CubicO group peptidase (beta-lactamase class C family)